jgi:endonuclease/exonuclease/phosphatase family metal-dependent hydrolase
MKNLIFIALLIGANSCGTIKKHSSQNTGSNAQELKIMSYNIHIGNPPSKPKLIDINSIVKAIKAENPDLIALQEVDVNTNRSGKINQAEIIARNLGMNYFFAKAIDHDGGDYGVCILSKYPISETKIHRLTSILGTGGEPRVLATAKVELEDGSFIRFGSTHLDAQANPINREIQIKEINKIAEAEILPFILAGDLNAEEQSPVIREFDQIFTRSCTDCAPTFPVLRPDRTIDYIAFKTGNKFKTLKHEVVQEHYASDHLPIISIFRLEK